MSRKSSNCGIRLNKIINSLKTKPNALVFPFLPQGSQHFLPFVILFANLLKIRILLLSHLLSGYMTYCRRGTVP